MADKEEAVAQEEAPSWVYGTEEATYDVRALEVEAQQAFALLVEVNGEVQGLNKRLSVLQAAGVQFNTLIQNALKEEAIIETKETQEEED
jgi:hypothetical protein